MWWSNKQVALHDADGDGALEVLVSAPRGERDGVWRIAVEDGRPEGFLTAGDWRLATGPQVLSDGRIAVAAELPGQDRTALIVYDTGVA